MPPSSGTRRAGRRALVASVVVTAAFLVGSARPATAAVPCWKTLLTDWYDGRIDNTYPLHCYTDALKHLRPDIEIYSSAHDDIERALQSAIERQHRLGKAVTPSTPLAPTTVQNKPVSRVTVTFVDTPPAAVTNRRPSRGPTRPRRIALAPVAGSAGGGLPIPLLVTGALAALLVAAGLGTSVVKRLRRSSPSG
jgi:hypothetical protein